MFLWPRDRWWMDRWWVGIHIYKHVHIYVCVNTAWKHEASESDTRQTITATAETYMTWFLQYSVPVGQGHDGMCQFWTCLGLSTISQSSPQEPEKHLSFRMYANLEKKGTGFLSNGILDHSRKRCVPELDCPGMSTCKTIPLAASSFVWRTWTTQKHEIIFMENYLPTETQPHRSMNYSWGIISQQKPQPYRGPKWRLSNQQAKLRSKPNPASTIRYTSEQVCMIPSPRLWATELMLK